MAVITAKSAVVTGYTADPKVPISRNLGGGPTITVVGKATSTAAGDIGSLFRFFALPVDCILHSLFFGSDDVGTGGDIDIGLYSLDDAGAITVIDADEFVTALDINAAALAPADKRFTNKGIETCEQKLWELAGLSERPDYNYMEVVGTLTEASTAAGDLYCRATITV